LEDFKNLGITPKPITPIIEEKKVPDSPSDPLVEVPEDWEDLVVEETKDSSDKENSDDIILQLLGNDEDFLNQFNEILSSHKQVDENIFRSQLVKSVDKLVNEINSGEFQTRIKRISLTMRNYYLDNKYDISVYGLFSPSKNS
jgi:hypothetical protein